jgi:dissimilatory sulfite reductase related protein
MPLFEYGDLKLQVDEDGFLEVPELWDEKVASALASTEEITVLTENHWKVINYLRDYFKEYNIAPMIRKLCKETGFTLKQIYELFPSGPAKGACKVAGLAKPTGCV